MRALYSHICRLRMACALVQGTMTLAFDGWTALMPTQRLLLGCGLAVFLRIVIPSPPSAGNKLLTSTDRLLSIIAAVSVVALTATEIGRSCGSICGLVLGL